MVCTSTESSTRDSGGVGRKLRVGVGVLSWVKLPTAVFGMKGFGIVLPVDAALIAGGLIVVVLGLSGQGSGTDLSQSMIPNEFVHLAENAGESKSRV